MITVTNGNDSGAGSLRQALADAVADEVIDFDSGVTLVGLTSAELLISQNQVITGPGSALLTIQRSSGGFRIFNCASGVIDISGLSVLDGLQADGGGIRCETVLNLTDVVVSGCGSSGDGGGIWSNGTITATDCEITNNNCIGVGGGLYNFNTFNGFNTEITSNTSFAEGGGIWNHATCILSGGTLSLNTSTSATGCGAWNEGSLALTEYQISSNVGSAAVCIDNQFGTVTLTRCCMFDNNLSVNNSFGTFSIYNSTISADHNLAIFNDGSMDIKWSTITNNAFGGINNNTSAVLHLFNTILCKNLLFDLSTADADCISDGNNAFELVLVSAVPGMLSTGTGDLYGVSGPAINLGPLQNNGGSTLTHALLANSIAIDAGNNAGAPLTDQRLSPRIVNSFIDIGAFESDIVDCAVFTGTLPAWLTLEGDCFTVTPGSFRAATKTAADAAAQAALDAFITAALESGDLDCECSPGVCPTEPDFETTTQDLAITDETESPNRPGSFTNLVTFAGTAGQTVNIWMESPDFDTYLYLMNPSLAVVASDGLTGYLKDSPSRTSSVLHYTLLLTGTYTIDCTTTDPATTGDFTLVISNDPVGENVFGADTGNFMRDLVYAPTPNRLFCFNQIGNLSDDTGIYVADGCTGELLTSFFMPDSVPPSFIYNAIGACYNSVNGLIYVIRSDGTLYTLNPITYIFTSILAAAANPFNDGKGIVYDPVTNRVFMGVVSSGGYTDQGIRVIDCATNLEVSLVDVGGAMGSLAYADTGFVYVSVGTTVKKVETTTLVVTDSGLTCKNNERIVSVVERQLLFINTTAFSNFKYDIVDYTTDTIVDTKNGAQAGMQGAVWDPFQSMILISSYGDTSGSAGKGVAFYEPVGKTIDNFISIDEAAGIAYVAASNSVFVTSRSVAGLFKIV